MTLQGGPQQSPQLPPDGMHQQSFQGHEHSAHNGSLMWGSHAQPGIQVAQQQYSGPGNYSHSNWQAAQAQLGRDAGLGAQQPQQPQQEQRFSLPPQGLVHAGQAAHGQTHAYPIPQNLAYPPPQGGQRGPEPQDARPELSFHSGGASGQPASHARQDGRQGIPQATPHPPRAQAGAGPHQRQEHLRQPHQSTLPPSFQGGLHQHPMPAYSSGEPAQQAMHGQGTVGIRAQAGLRTALGSVDQSLLPDARFQDYSQQQAAQRHAGDPSTRHQHADQSKQEHARVGTLPQSMRKILIYHPAAHLHVGFSCMAEEPGPRLMLAVVVVLMLA